jgi:RNA polymerase sigma-70 factor (ECF subfamily)
VSNAADSVRPIRNDVAVSDTASFERFYEAERTRLYRALLLLTGTSHEAEEVMQEAFLRLWERWPRVRGLEDPSGYLYRTAMNGFRSRYRRAKLATRKTIRMAHADDPFESVAARDEALR